MMYLTVHGITGGTKKKRKTKPDVENIRNYCPYIFSPVSWMSDVAYTHLIYLENFITLGNTPR